MLLIPDLAFFFQKFSFFTPLSHLSSDELAADKAPRLPNHHHLVKCSGFFFIHYLIYFFCCVQPLVSCATDVPQLLRQWSDDWRDVTQWLCTWWAKPDVCFRWIPHSRAAGIPIHPDRLSKGSVLEMRITSAYCAKSLSENELRNLSRYLGPRGWFMASVYEAWGQRLLVLLIWKDDERWAWSSKKYLH